MSRREMPAGRLNVLQMADTLGGGGAEKALVDLALNLDRSKFRVGVCATRVAGGYLPLLEAADVPVTILGRRSRWEMYKMAGLVRVLRRRPVHILHTHLFGSNTWGRVLGRLSGVPVIISHEHWSAKRRLEVRVDRVLYRLSDRILTTSEASKHNVMETDHVPSRYVSVVYNGVDTAIFAPGEDGQEIRRELGVGQDTVLVGSVGRLDPRKGGQDLLIGAMAEIGRSHPGARLVMVGDGPLRPELEALSGNLGADVIFTGVRSDVARMLRAMDIFVLPSLYEALPVAILEALATGLPVVATRVGGIPEVMGDGETGIVVPPRDQAALQEMLGRLVADPALRARMGRRALEHANKHFTVERMAREVGEIYLQIAAQKLRPARVAVRR